MRIVETSVFTRQVVAALPDEEYRALRATLVERPDLGARIPGGGGLRKVRWGLPGRGKRGGVRVIYYWAVGRDTIVVLFLYPKNVRGDALGAQLRALRRIIEQEYPMSNRKGIEARRRARRPMSDALFAESRRACARAVPSCGERARRRGRVRWRRGRGVPRGAVQSRCARTRAGRRMSGHCGRGFACRKPSLRLSSGSARRR